MQQEGRRRGGSCPERNHSLVDVVDRLEQHLRRLCLAKVGLDGLSGGAPSQTAHQHTGHVIGGGQVRDRRLPSDGGTGGCLRCAIQGGGQ